MLNIQNCEFELHDELWICALCGLPAHTKGNKPPHRNCSKFPIDNTLILTVTKDIRLSQPIIEYGPGTELHNILLLFGFSETSSCGCSAFADQMNLWGPDGCLEHMQEIVDWMVAQFKERRENQEGLSMIAKRIVNNTPYFAIPIFAKKLVKQAIRQARKKICANTTQTPT